MKVFIKIQGPTGVIKHYPIEEAPITIGRKISAKICIDDEELSGIHARFFVEGNSLYVEDLGSKNGTSLNGIRIFKQRFCNGDKLVIGSTKVTIDPQKNDKMILSKLARKGTGITLNLQTKEETFKEVRKKSAISKRATHHSKLYNERKKQVKKPNKQSEVKESLAFAIDLALAVVVFFITLHLGEMTFPPVSDSMESQAISAYFEGDMLFLSIGAILAAYVSFIINRGKGHRASLGEKILGLD